MKRSNSRFLSLAVFLVIVFWSVTAMAGTLDPTGPPAPTMKTLDQVEARIPLGAASQVAGVITISTPGSYYLTENITNLAGNAIKINSSHVTVDLNGFTLFGGAAGYGVGFDDPLLTHMVVKNGQVSGFSSGISLADYSRVVGVLVKNSSSVGIGLGQEGSIQGSQATSCGNYGFYLGLRSTISGCRAYANSGYGIYGTPSLVNGNVSASNGKSGIETFGPGSIRNNVVLYNGWSGIKVSDSLVAGNTALSNNGVGGTYKNMDCSGCTLVDNNVPVP